MFLPRRCYRRLLLPPGWLALGFLLLLGCLALMSHERQLSVETILQLTMPLSKKKVEERRRAGEPYYQLFSNPLDSLNTTTHWYNVNFDGAALNDFINKAAVETVVPAMKADTSHAKGVRIYFRQGATYGNLVSLVDLMNRLRYRYYWFDIEHHPTTFYVVNNQAARRRESAEIPRVGCCMCMTELDKVSGPLPSFLQIAQQALSSLWQQGWRPSALLLAVISSLSIYQLSRSRQTAR